MGYLISVDPGAYETGLAYFAEGTLVDVSLYRASGVLEMASILRIVRIDGELAIERPKYRPEDLRSNPDKLLQLAMVVGACLNMAQKQTLYYPHEWKGSVPKRIHQPRILARLTPHEKSILEQCALKVPIALQHNMIDAIGVGLFHLGRLSI